MEPEASLSWLALTMTPGIAARLSARLLNEFGSPENVFRASLTALEACNLPAPVAQAIFKKQTFWRAEKRGGGHSARWLPFAALARAGIPPDTSADL
jgi:predicted Rossmann fold nucleotide-binding protein DprA/Smf involved in DNA uptake